MACEQVAVEMGQACNARCESEEAPKANIEDLAKLARAVGVVMTGLRVPLELVSSNRLIEEVGRLPGVIRELELSTARRVVHRVLAIFESHYKGVDGENPST
jgi:chloramphenicol 3-O-phosphotransferase